MITANTIGFVLGLDNTLFFLKQVFGTWQGISFVFQAGIGLFAAVQIMFEYRSVHFPVRFITFVGLLRLTLYFRF